MKAEWTARELAEILHGRPRDEPVVLRECRPRDALQPVTTYRVVAAETEFGEWRIIIERREP